MGGSPGSCKRALFVGRQLSMVASWIPLSSYFNCGELWTGEGLSAPLEGDRASGPAAAASAPAAASVEQSPAAADATKKGIREYSPVADACWAAGQPAPYMHLAQALAVLGPPPPFPSSSPCTHWPSKPPVPPCAAFHIPLSKQRHSGVILHHRIRDRTHRTQLDERGCSAGLQAMDCTTKRLKISDVVCNMFRSVLALSPGGTVPLKALRSVAGCMPPSWRGSGTRPSSRGRFLRFHPSGHHSAFEHI